MRILITGVNGFVGKHLAQHLKNKGLSVIATAREAQPDADIASFIDGFIGNCDLSKPADISKLPLADVDAVINLAALAQVGASFDKEEEYKRINVAVQTNIAKAILRLGKPVRLLAISTGAVYDSNQSMPLTEESRLTASGSPYAQSKIAMEEALNSYEEQGVDIVIARPFNHTGPGQSPGFLIPDLVQQMLNSSSVRVGNLKTKRDYTDVRDVVRAYATLATAPTLKHKVYNVCSGKSVSGEEVLSQILRAADKKAEIDIDQSKIRPHDPENIIGSYGRIKQEFGWEPTISLTQTIKDYLASL